AAAAVAAPATKVALAKPPKLSKEAPKPKPPTSVTVDHVSAPGLLDYGTHLLVRSGVIVPSAEEQKRRGRSFVCYNACVSPSHVVSGWGLAALSADEKTRHFVEKMLEEKALDLTISKKSKTADDTLHPSINCIVYELGPPSFVRLYIEPQFAIPQITAIVDEINGAYGDTDAPVIKPLCFSCDDSGDATARKINHDVSTFTQKRISTVIDMHANLNRLAQACVVSAFASTFMWRLTDQAAQPVWSNFYGGMEKKKSWTSKIRSLTDSGAYRFTKSDQYDCIELCSENPAELCYLIRPNNQPISEWITSVSGSFIDQMISELPKAKQITVSVPVFTVETPMRLGEAASQSRGHYSLWRLFDREKCKLTRIFYKNQEDSLCTLPLWDHYHQTVFQLTCKPLVQPVAVQDAEQPKTDIELLDAVVENKPEERLGGGTEDGAKAAKWTYHKTEDCTHELYKEEPRPPQIAPNGDTSAMPGKLSFDTPFLFVVRKLTGKSAKLPVCLGIFSNTDTDDQHDVA
ncbi:hypothetical protein PFISCL1PPCAC_11255, partial [Pristionchus fissidentatus]